MIVWKNLRYEDTASIVECEMTFEEYNFCEGILAIYYGTKLWEEVWENN